MSHVYLVNYDTGEYDDYVTVPVRAFLDRSKAEDFVATLNKRLLEEHLLRNDSDFFMDYDKADQLRREFEEQHDLTIRISYTGSSFHVLEVLLAG